VTPNAESPAFEEAEFHHHHIDHDKVDVNPPESWTDPKRYAWALATLIPAAPFIAFGLDQFLGLGIAYWLGPFLVFVLFPFLDHVIGVDSENPPDSILKWLEEDKYYRRVTYAWVPIQYIGLVFACWIWASDQTTLFGDIGLMLTMGTVNGIAIATAHELGHKRPQLERWLSKIALAPTFYGHFYIEHNRGHHVRVSTPEDPASSRLGESFYAFWPRTVVGSLKSAIHLEKTRLERVGTGFWTLKNDLLNAWLISIALFTVLTVGSALAFEGGWIVLPFLLGQAVIGFSLLEVVNYLEHYALLREKRDDGRYERAQPKHSWNSNMVASNVFLFHLQRHSDHHAYPTRRYQALRHYEEAPELPEGYATMIVYAMFPPVWRRVMDQRVVDHYGGDVTKLNLHPRKREKLIKKYGGNQRGGDKVQEA
jgi:alkane 1-monooxygenase